MPRRPRVFIEGLTYHVYNRVGRGEAPFALEEEAERFWSLLHEAKERDGLTILAWCIMPNHYHLAVRTGAVPLWRSMRMLQHRYAQAFNRRCKVFGPREVPGTQLAELWLFLDEDTRMPRRPRGFEGLTYHVCNRIARAGAVFIPVRGAARGRSLHGERLTLEERLASLESGTPRLKEGEMVMPATRGCCSITLRRGEASVELDELGVREHVRPLELD
jgi:REP element-mobilizing transposase RayT